MAAVPFKRGASQEVNEPRRLLSDKEQGNI
jgi:hypothetical protein